MADYFVQFNWANTSAVSTTTAPTVEVDVMPQLARVNEGGSFPGYASAISNLGARYVRFSPWYAYPKVVVAELAKAECSANGKGSSWNVTHLDGIVADFMLAVCGPRAADGECEGGLSVVPQLSTMPEWMYESDGVNRTALMPSDPWQYPSDKFDYYLVKGKPLRDPTCREMARYAARLVGWYTKGGFTDECGVRHTSSWRYKWDLLSVLNEDEYGTPPGGGVQYTVCWDAWKEEIAKVNPEVKLVGPETAGGAYGSTGSSYGSAGGTSKRRQRQPPGLASDPMLRREALGGQLDYSLYFLNGSNHDDGQPPPYVSNHVALYGGPQDAWLGLFEGVDEWVSHVATPLEAARRQLAPGSVLVMNEFIPFQQEWCNTSFKPPAGRPPPTCDWAGNSSIGARMDRATLGWNAAAASFAYGFGMLSEMRFGWVGADQLIGGVWPDNEPAVASLDWTTGEPNAKYWAVRMLARRLGATPRKLYAGRVTGGPPPPKPGTLGNGTCGNTNYGGDCSVLDRGAWNTTSEGIASLADCVARCRRGCSKCEFVSLSLKNEDCSWYKECDLDRLMKVAGYQSEAIAPHEEASQDLYALGMRLASPQGAGAGGDERVLLVVSKVARQMNVSLGSEAAGASAEVLEGVGAEPGMEPPKLRRADAQGRLVLGPFAVALVSLDGGKGGGLGSR